MAKKRAARKRDGKAWIPSGEDLGASHVGAAVRALARSLRRAPPIPGPLVLMYGSTRPRGGRTGRKEAKVSIYTARDARALWRRGPRRRRASNRRSPGRQRERVGCIREVLDLQTHVGFVRFRRKLVLNRR